jgi:predicted helicase
MQPYYAAIRAAAAQITSHSEKQTFLKLIYEQFYKVYNPKAADRLGVVYTPNEIVRFMIEGADWLCEKHFGKTLIEPGVEILDPATGTGTFICELIEHFRGQPKALARKYKEELHANEVAILPYYVANLNIEATYAAVAGQYAEFPNLCFVDTLDNVAGLGIRAGHQGELFGAMSDENVERVKRQNSRKISVVIGNPPYNPRQEYYDQGNANRRYKRIDQTMKDTYIRLGKAQNKNAVYDMYTRFLRWATDRVHDDGIITFITNRNFIEKAAFDGVRKSLAEEFHEVWLVDLGGDVRANPKLSGTMHNVFGIQTGVAIYFLVKKRKSKAGLIRYARRPEFETAQDKLAFLGSTPLSRTHFESITPSKTGDWIDAVSSDWSEFLPLCSKDQKAGHSRADGTIFKLFSLGNASHRDEWVYDVSPENLGMKVQFFINAYEESRKDPNSAAKGTIRWDADLERYANSKVAKVFDPALIRRAQFRPFASRYLYFDQNLNARTYQLSTMFPTGGENRVISVSSVGFRSGYCVFSSDGPVDLHFGAAADGYQIVSRYRYTPTGERVDNVTDWALKTFTDRYGKTAGVSRDTIFAYVYAALHDPLWRETYAINLKREFPRIPLHPEFRLWAGWGQRLLDLHIGYEGVEPWPVSRRDVADVKAKAAGVSPRVILKSDPGAGVVVLDSETTLTGIPARAWEYRLGNRSAIDWVLDQHKEKVPKDPTIRAKFNTYRFADHKERVVGLLTRVVRVSLETLDIVEDIRAAKR